MATQEDNEDSQSPMEDTEDEVSATPETETDGKGDDTAPDNDSGVALSEEFQRETTDIIQQATQPELEFMRSLIMEREKELHKALSPGSKSGTFDTVGLPPDE